MKKKKNNRFYIALGMVIITSVIEALFLLQQNKNPYQSLPNYATNECGDMQDLSNIQDLSHHPQQYKDCIRSVEPQKFFEATGQSLDDFAKRNGIA